MCAGGDFGGDPLVRRFEVLFDSFWSLSGVQVDADGEVSGTRWIIGY